VEEAEARVDMKRANCVGKQHNLIIDFGSATELEPAAYNTRPNDVVKIEPEKPMVLSPFKALFISSSFSSQEEEVSRIYHRPPPSPAWLDSATAALAAPGYPPLVSFDW
jgi:hypothetical protein